ncbi:MAG: helix-turn-helix domain-containing protein, partial [Rhodococcus sp. (in: high G+C Gram-positive bacteria)]
MRAQVANTAPKPDARSERWREHRLLVRQSFVDAALAAIDRYGPEVSMGDIAKTAGAAKPKLYRHFADKSDLYAAIVEHVQEMLWDRILQTINLFEDSVATLVSRGTSEYALIVSE